MISSLIVKYGYLMLFLGSLAEGESALLAAGFAVHQALLDWWLVILVASLGGTLGDQLIFLLGRWKGKSVLARFPSIAQRAPKVLALLERHDIGIIIGVRFLYGLRIAGPLVIGASGVPLLRFAVLNMLGAVLWAITIGGAGYYFGATLTALMADLGRLEGAVLIGLPVVALLFCLTRRRLQILHRSERTAASTMTLGATSMRPSGKRNLTGKKGDAVLSTRVFHSIRPQGARAGRS